MSARDSMFSLHPFRHLLIVVLFFTPAPACSMLRVAVQIFPLQAASVGYEFCCAKAHWRAYFGIVLETFCTAKTFGAKSRGISLGASQILEVAYLICRVLPYKKIMSMEASASVTIVTVLTPR